MLSEEEREAMERIEDFLTTNIIISISNDETANSEELKAFISKNEYLSIEFIASMFLKRSKEIEELKMQLEVEKIDNKYNQEEASEEMIPRYKIREKIKSVDYSDHCKAERIAMKEILQSLLEKE